MFGLTLKKPQKVETPAAPLPVITNFEYIEKKFDEVSQRKATVDLLPKEDKKAAKAKGQRRVAGFLVHDEEEEKKALDALVEKQAKALKAFIKDRKEIRAKLEKIGVTPLAVVPSKAWFAICQKAGLIVMAPDSDGKVNISRAGIDSYKSAGAAEAAAANDHDGYIRTLFPNEVARGMHAHVILPEPPADVAATLLKVKDFGLKVAAVPAAISILETPTELFQWSKARHEEEERRREWLRNDPIIYTEHGTASAIIAQFGDFPVEQQIVDLVIENDDLIEEKPSAASPAYYSDPAETYRRQVQLQAMQGGLLGLGYSSGGAAGLSGGGGGGILTNTTAGGNDAWWYEPSTDTYVNRLTGQRIGR